MDSCTLVSPPQLSAMPKHLTRLSLQKTVVQLEARSSLYALLKASSASLRDMTLLSTRSCIDVWEASLSEATSLSSLSVVGEALSSAILHQILISGRGERGRLRVSAKSSLRLLSMYELWSAPLPTNLFFVYLSYMIYARVHSLLHSSVIYNQIISCCIFSSRKFKTGQCMCELAILLGK